MHSPEPSSKKKIPKKLKAAEEAYRSGSLEHFAFSEEVGGLSLNEKEFLGRLFCNRGSELMGMGQIEKAIGCYERALQLDPAKPEIYFSLARAHLKQENEESYIQANLLFAQGEKRLISLGQIVPVQVLWEWGLSLSFLAKCSEEAIDFKQAIEKFHEAYEVGLRSPLFYLDYGSVLTQFGILLGKQELMREGAKFLEFSLKEDSSNAESWFRLATTYKILYFLSGDIDCFEKADQAFLAVARIKEDHFSLWLDWGQLLAMEAKMVRDESLLISALEKLEKSEQEKGDDPVVLTTLADVLIHLGVLSEKVELLKEAKDKLERVLEVAPSFLDARCLLGQCYIHLGRYFTDFYYLELALDQFEKGISNNKEFSSFWHGLANAHFALGEMKQDPSEYKKAAEFCSEAVRLNREISNYWNDWGVALMKLGDYTSDAIHIAGAVEKFEEAIKCFNRKQKGAPDPDWIYNYGCALDFLGEFEHDPRHYERAIAVLAQLHEQYPDSLHIRYNLGLALYHLGDSIGDEEVLAKAIFHLEYLANKDPEDDNILNDLGLACLTLADIYIDSFQNDLSGHYFSRAEHFFSQALAAGGIEANYWLGCLYALQENLSEAMYFLERAKSNGVLPLPIDLMNNEWLNNLKHIPSFKTLLADLEKAE